MAGLPEEKLLEVCRCALAWARERDYTGREKHDALNSPMLQAAFGWGKWPRILAIQMVMRSPVNIRPLLGVRPHRNPKGLALFARAHMNMHRATGDESSLAEARLLLDWLLENPSQGFRGVSWGYPYPWQDLGFYAPSGMPNRIVTYFVGRAMIHAWEATGEDKYLRAAEKAVEFILEEQTILHENGSTKCVSYAPIEGMVMAVMDVPALCGALCAMVGRHTGRQELMIEAKKLMAWVADKQTGYGAWFYTHPAGDSHITHDNYHTGEIVDAFLEYELYSVDPTFHRTYEEGLRYYRENLFTSSARPRWMNDREFPHDVHGYSQGIITFAMAGDLDLARGVAQAALEDMFDEKEGRFYYQRWKRRTNRYTPMRWSQAWMCFALSCLVVQTREAQK